MPRRLTSVLFVLTLGVSCGGNPDRPTPNPSATVAIQTVRYERAYPFDPAATGFMTLSIEHKIPGDKQGRSEIHFCFLKPIGDGTFGCLDVESPGGRFTAVPVGTENHVFVSDPAMPGIHRRVAARIWINGQLVTRITRYQGEDEVGHFTYPLFDRTTFK